MTYKWWRYFEADTYQEYSGSTKAVETINEEYGLSLGWTRQLDENEVVDAVTLTGADSEKMTFAIPDDAKAGDSFHIILEVKDDGELPLKAYQRVIITVE